MKKKIVSLVLAMTLVLAYAVPVAATDAETSAPNEVTVTEETAVPNGAAVSEDPAVQATYDAFEAMAAAYDSGDYAAMKAARDTFWASQEEYTDAQTAAWENIVTNTIGQDRYDTVTTDAGWLVDGFEPAYNDFVAEKNANTAYNYVKVYEYLDWIAIDKFFADASALYEEAKAMAPTSENVIKVYEAYEDLMYWFTDEYNGVGSMAFEDSYEEFEALLDTFNELTEDEFTQLAGLLGVANGEEAFSLILNDWIVVNVAVEVASLADAFNDSYSVADAKAFVEYYDSIVESGMFTEEELELIIYRYSYDSVYEDALYAIETAADDDQNGEEPAATDGDVSDKEDSPATGDDFNAAPYAALMVIAAAAAGMVVKRRKVQ